MIGGYWSGPSEERQQRNTAAKIAQKSQHSSHASPLSSPASIYCVKRRHHCVYICLLLVYL